jgi:hypothetical protein
MRKTFLLAGIAILLGAPLAAEPWIVQNPPGDEIEQPTVPLFLRRNIMVVCGPVADALLMLRKEFSETVVPDVSIPIPEDVSGTAARRLILTRNDTTGSWTVLDVFASGEACALFGGNDKAKAGRRS